MSRKVTHYHRKPWGHDRASCGTRATAINSTEHIDRVNCTSCLLRVIDDAATERSQLMEKINQVPVSRLIELARLLEPKTPVELLSRALMREASAHMLRCEVRFRQIKVRPAKRRPKVIGSQIGGKG